MQILRSLDEWNAWRESQKTSSIGLVTTMGNLHLGHASLLKRARLENDITILTLYVNPTQFNNANDFQQYPKTLEADLELARESDVDAVLLPTDTMMYTDNHRFSIHESLENQRLEGLARPGHFTGMLTIVMKLLMLTQPKRAYFGEKDYQQFCLVRDMCKAFFIQSEIIACETIRMSSGLPFSSRNTRLNAVQLSNAHRFAEIIRQDKPISVLSEELAQLGLRVDYLEDTENRRYAAVFIDDIRLIDNFELKKRGAS